MDWRLRGIPPALWRLVRDKAGDKLQQVLLGLLDAYAQGKIDPLADGKDPLQAARGAKGGAARVANQSPKERSASARLAARARWQKYAAAARAEGGGAP